MEENNIYKFKVTFPKEAKNLAKCVGKEAGKFSSVLILPNESWVTASNQMVVQVYKIEIESETPISDYKSPHQNSWNNLPYIPIFPNEIGKLVGKTVNLTVEHTEKEYQEKVSGQVITKKRAAVIVKADGETVYDSFAYGCPNIPRVIPKEDNYFDIQLTSESAEILKKIAKLFKSVGYISAIATEGSDYLTVGSSLMTFNSLGHDPSCVFRLKLAQAPKSSFTFGIKPDSLLRIMNGWNGTIKAWKSQTPLILKGEADASLMMPLKVDDDVALELKNISEKFIPSECVSNQSFEQITKQLHEASDKYWQGVIKSCTSNDGKCRFPAGNYSASQLLSNSLKTYLRLPDEEEWEEDLYFKAGGIYMYSLWWINVPYALSVWETISKEKKTFSVGNLQEATEYVLEPNEDCSDVVEKKKRLRVLGDGVYAEMKRADYRGPVPVYIKINERLIKARDVYPSELKDENSSAIARVKSTLADGSIVRWLQEQAKDQPYWAKVVEKLGLTSTTLSAAAVVLKGFFLFYF